MRIFGRPVARSFDMFDTLIARRCKDPGNIFKIVEARSGAIGFADAREQAERRVQCGGEYTLDTIYKELPTLLQVSLHIAERLKALEIAVEIEQTIPIAENIRRVRDGDIVVSDMYLPTEVLNQMLAKAGLRKNVEIFVSAHGKRSGTIWKEIRRRYHIAGHLGDSAHSDFRSAALRAIPPQMTKASRFSDAERTLSDMGLTELALVARHARLSLWHDDWLMRRLQRLQADSNFPLLLLASLRLMEVIEEVGATRVLFCSRDGNLWIHLFEKMRRALGIEIKVEYFYTSRLARLNCSRDYQAYCRELLGRETLVVDISGTGWSMSCLADALDVSSVNCFFLHHIPQLTSYERLRPMKSNIEVHSLLSKDDKWFWNALLEMCNYADHASVLDVELQDGQFKPILMPETRTPDQLHAVAVQREAFLISVDAVPETVLRNLKELPQVTRKAACIAIYREIAQERALTFMFQRAHSTEDQAVMTGIGAVPNAEPRRRVTSIAVARLKHEIRRLQLRFESR